MPAVAIFLFLVVVLTSIAPRKANAQTQPPSEGKSEDDLAKTVAKVVEQYIQGQNKPQK